MQYVIDTLDTGGHPLEAAEKSFPIEKKRMIKASVLLCSVEKHLLASDSLLFPIACIVQRSFLLIFRHQMRIFLNT
jgi:hypothetical protein